MLLVPVEPRARSESPALPTTCACGEHARAPPGGAAGASSRTPQMFRLKSRPGFVAFPENLYDGGPCFSRDILRSVCAGCDDGLRRNSRRAKAAAGADPTATRRTTRITGPRRLEVYCEDVALSRIAAATGTPAYVYSRASIEGAYRHSIARLERCRIRFVTR